MKLVNHIVKNEDDSLRLVRAKGFVPPGAVGILPEGEDVRWLEMGDVVTTYESVVYQKDGNGEVLLDVNGEQLPELDVNGNQVMETISETHQQPKVNATLKAQILAEGDVAALAKEKEDAVVDYYNNMTVEVYAEMKNIFYTTKSDSASANYEMWKHMVANAGLYSAKGLKAEYQLNNADDTELYSPGSALDTDEKVVAYAARKLEQADVYIVWRSDRIQQFRNEKEAIQNS